MDKTPNTQQGSKEFLARSALYDAVSFKNAFTQSVMLFIQHHLDEIDVRRSLAALIAIKGLQIDAEPGREFLAAKSQFCPQCPDPLADIFHIRKTCV